MTTHDDILTCIADGRLAIERTVAFSMACTLAKVEAMVREMRPTSEPVTIERGNTADLADAEDMRSLLMEQGQEPSAAGLAEFIRFARMGEDEKDEALKGCQALRGELDCFAAALRNSIRKRDTLADEVTALRAQIADLTPGPWVRIGDQPPIEGEIVLMRTTEGDIPWIQTVFSFTLQREWEDFFWRRLPAALLALPETAETVTP